MNFRLKNDMIQQVQNSCQFHGLPSDDANKHLDKFLHVTQSIKVNEVTDDALRLYLFPYSLTHHSTAWFDRLPRNSINTFEQMAKMILGKYFPPSMVTKLINEITNFRQRPDESLFEAWERYKLSIDRCPNHNMLLVTQIYTFYNGLTLRHRDTINVAAGGTFMKRRSKECYDLIENMIAPYNDWDTSAQRSESSSSITSSSNTEIAVLKAEMAKINKILMRVLQVNQQVKAVTPNFETYGGPHSFFDCLATVGNTQNVYVAGAYQGNTITNPKEDLKGIITQSGTAYQGPTILTTSSPVVERETEATKDMVHPTNNERTKDVQPLVVQTESPILNSELVVALIIEPVASPDLNFNISFADALILMPKFGPSIKTLLTNKDKLCELDRTPLNEHCLAVLLKKLPEKLGDPVKFLIPCDFPEMAECLALADLDASFNLMPLSELKICEAKTDKSSIDEPLEVELKDLPPHLEYVFLEGDDKLPVIIKKDLSVEEKTALITVLKSHKRAIAWKLSVIKGNDPEFCTHKILMEEDFEPAVQHQRWFNPNIHDAIKNEVLKLLDAGLIYPISDSPWISYSPGLSMGTLDAATMCEES
uniref:Reverse transcriptase domain-containing protein n=1 Tax=Tanacetum cinerariifolium TaxID=118510 RepID=A0A6L2JJ16_TANCI|nr:reverse transcriptase domain-containing protein [Tanacetum cinerariifolium]